MPAGKTERRVMLLSHYMRTVLLFNYMICCASCAQCDICSLAFLTGKLQSFQAIVWLYIHERYYRARTVTLVIRPRPNAKAPCCTSCHIPIRPLLWVS